MYRCIIDKKVSLYYICSFMMLVLGGIGMDTLF